MSREAIATAPHLRATPRFIWSMQSSPFHDVTLAAFEQGVEYQTMWLLTGQRMRDARERAAKAEANPRGLTDDERRELHEYAAAEAKRLTDAQDGLPRAMCRDRPVHVARFLEPFFEPHERGLFAPFLKNAKPYRWRPTVDGTMRFRETPAQSRCDDGANCGAHDSDCWHATYGYGAPLPPGDTRPPVLGGECARCFARPPYHERWCPKRKECVR